MNDIHGTIRNPGSGGPAIESSPPSLTDSALHPTEAASTSRIARYWWGWRIALTNTETIKATKVAACVAGAAGLAAGLQAAGLIAAGSCAATSVAAGLLALGVSAVDLCNWNEKGICLYVTRIGASWFWPR